MTDVLPTIKIKSDKPKGFRIINASAFDAAKHERFVELPAAPPPPPLPPPPPPGPLDILGEDWKAKSPAELRELAQRVTGRTAENKLQAVQMIEAALAARAK